MSDRPSKRALYEALDIWRWMVAQVLSDRPFGDAYDYRMRWKLLDGECQIISLASSYISPQNRITCFAEQL